MGSVAAMGAGGSDRYFQQDAAKFVPAGVEGRIPYRGPLSETVYQLAGGVRAGMGYVGAPDIQALRTQSKFIRTTMAGYRESHPHDIQLIKEPPNYTVLDRLE